MVLARSVSPCAESCNTDCNALPPSEPVPTILAWISSSLRHRLLGVHLSPIPPRISFISDNAVHSTSGSGHHTVPFVTNPTAATAETGFYELLGCGGVSAC